MISYSVRERQYFVQSHKPSTQAVGDLWFKPKTGDDGTFTWWAVYTWNLINWVKLENYCVKNTTGKVPDELFRKWTTFVRDRNSCPREVTK